MAEKKTYSTEEKLFLALWTFYSVFYFLFSVSELSLDYDVDFLYNWARDFTMILQVILLFYMNKNSIRKMMVCFAALLLTFLVESAIGSRTFQITIVFILLASQIDFDKILRFDIKLKTALLVIIVGLCLFGVTLNYTDTINGNYKMSLGFGHPNTLTCYALILLVEWLCIRYKRMKWYEWLLILAAWGLVMETGGGRTTGYTFLAIYVLFVLAAAVPKIFYTGFSKVCFAVITPVMAVLSFVLAWLYQSGNALAVQLNSVITNRFSYASRFLDEYGIKLFGQKIQTVGTRQHLLTGEPSMILDNAYVRMAVNWGAVLFIIILVLFSAWFLRALKNNRVEIALFGLFFVVIGFAENYMTNPMYDLSFLFLLNGLNGKEAKKEFPSVHWETKAEMNRIKSSGYSNLAMGIVVLLLAWCCACGRGNRYISFMIYPFIFLIFGLLYSKESTIREYLTKILKTIYIPFAFWNVLFYTARSIYAGRDFSSILSMDLKVVLTLDEDSAYFRTIWILGGFVLIALAYKLADTALADFKYKEYVLLILFGAAAILGFQITLPYHLSRTFILGFFFAAGAFLKKNWGRLRELFYPCNAVICALIFLFIAFNHSADMELNTYSNVALFVIGALCASYALLVFVHSLENAWPKFMQPVKRGLSYLGEHWIDVVIWQFFAFKIVTAVQMSINNEAVTFIGVLTHDPVYSTAFGWSIAYLVVGIAVPILFCNLMRMGPLGKLTKKLHVV